MATTINSAGSQMFQRNLAEYNDERNRDDRAQQAEGQRLGRQLTALGLDPDVDDPRLAKLGMAASIAPSGILGTVVKGIAQVKGMDAMQLKADAGKERNERMADMIRSNFEEMSEEDAMMYARNPKAFEQFKSITDYKDSKTDRKRRITREDELIQRDDEQYEEEQAIERDFENNKEGYRETLTEMGLSDIEIQGALRDSKSLNSFLSTSIFQKGSDNQDRESLFNQNKDKFAQYGIHDYGQLQMMRQLPGNLGLEVFKTGYASKYITQYNDLLDERNVALSKINQGQAAAGKIALDIMYRDETVEADYQNQVDEDGEPISVGPLGPEEIDAHRQVMFQRDMNKKDSKTKAYYDELVGNVLSEHKTELARVTGKLSTYAQMHPTLLKLPTYSDASYRDKAIQRLRPGDFFRNGANLAMVIPDPRGGRNLFVEEMSPHFDKERYEKRHGGGELKDIFAPVRKGGVDGVPDNDEVGDTGTGDLGAGGTPRLDKEVSEIAKLNKKYQSLLSQASSKGATEEAKLTEDETAIGKGLRNISDRISNEYSNSLIIPRSMHDGFTGTPYNPELIDSLKYAGVEDYSRFMYPADDVPGINANRTPRRINYEITKELQRRIKLLEKVIKPK